MYKFYKWFLVSAIVVLLTACGGGSSATETAYSTQEETTTTGDELSAQEVAIKYIANYAQNGGTPPTIQHYQDVGITGVNADNLSQINERVAGLTYDDVDTAEEIRALATELGIELPANTLPIANAGVDKRVQVNQTVSITGIGTDSDGTITAYEWKKDTTVLATTASFSYTPDTVGTDTLTLTVTDNEGAEATDSMSVTITAEPVPNTPPTANAGPDKSVQVNQNITITGIGTDNDGTITAYEWTKGSTVLARTASFSYTPDTIGTDTLTLTVTDNEGATATDSMSVTVTAEPVSNTPPTANAGADKSAQVNQTITITGSGTDTDGTITAYEWTKGTAVLATTASFNYTPDTVGTDTLTLTVTDNEGAAAIDSMNVTVTAEPSPDLQWNFFTSVAEGTQFDAQAGPNNRIHLISERYYQLNLSGDLLVDEDQGDEQEWLTSFPPAIAVGDDESVHIVTRDAGDVKTGVDIRYRRRSPAGSWDANYVVGDKVERNYVVGISWTDTDIIIGSTKKNSDDVYGDIRLWKAGESSESYLGALTGMWRADVDIRMRGQNNKIYLGAGTHNSSSGTVYFSQADTGTELRDRLNSNKKTHTAGSPRRSFPDLALDGQNNTHFVYGAKSEVYYNKYNASGEKIFGSDKRIFDNLGTWHLSIGLSAVAVSESGEIVVAVALYTKGYYENDEMINKEAADSDVLWAYSTDGGASWSDPQDTGKNSDAGEGRRRPRLINIGDNFILLYGDSTDAGISMGVLTF